jgi:hypothetical protein
MAHPPDRRFRRPPAVRLDDLAEPRFSAEAEALRTAMSDLAGALPLLPEALMEAAMAQTGLEDFGDGWFREPLDVLCTSLRTEADLSPSGVVGLAVQIIQGLVARLRLADLLERHPEIRDVPLERPIIIAGLPRTGTTHLHNLMSADTALRSLPYWESLEPVPPPGEDPADPAPRIARTKASLDTLELFLPHFKRMHDMWPEHVSEEIQLLTATCATILYETEAVIPSYRDWLRGTDQTPAYEYLRTMLQALTWLRPAGDRWLLKSPGHLEQLRVLNKVFPDAFVVVTHRDPVAVTRSICTMFTYLARMTQDNPDPSRIGRYWAYRFELLLDSCVAERDLLPDAMDVQFDEFMADDLAMVERIYARAGQPYTAEAASAMEAFMADHPRGKYGGVIYDLADFGLDRAERARALSGYTTRFGVQSETKE